MFWVLKCADQSYYTGHTDNLKSRLMQHHHKAIPGYVTATRLPVQLVFSQEFATRVDALASERQIKGRSRKKKLSSMEIGKLYQLMQKEIRNYKSFYIIHPSRRRKERASSGRTVRSLIDFLSHDEGSGQMLA